MDQTMLVPKHNEGVMDMQPEQEANTPQEPATQPADVREELHQENISKEGDPRTAQDAGAEMDSHFGAVEDDLTGHSDQTLVQPPMTGPYNLVDADGDDHNAEDVDPQDEIVDAG